jgi:NADH-quinone oxidoreductase subunit C
MPERDDAKSPGPSGPKPPPPPPRPDPLKAEAPCPPLDRARQAHGEAIEEVTWHAGEASIRVRMDRLIEVLRFLRDDEACGMDLLVDLCAADYPDRAERFEVVYHLYSIPRGHFLRVRVRTGEGRPVPSVTGLWATADWMEREAFDLFGVVFTGHPDLRRILMPDGWRGHPLRKEYPLAGFPDQHLRLR